MADFEFKAITVDGKTRTGHVAANNKQEAIAKLHNQHLKPLVIKQPKKSFERSWHTTKSYLYCKMQKKN